jgi:hypothetical protein
MDSEPVEFDWAKRMRPRPGGWARLSIKLSNADEERRQEVRLWRTVAMLLLVVTTTLMVRDLSSSRSNMVVIEKPRFGTLNVQDGNAVPVPGTPARVRFYWIVR